jgi:hypothetical protein
MLLPLQPFRTISAIKRSVSPIILLVVHSQVQLNGNGKMESDAGSRVPSKDIRVAESK